MSHHPNRHVDRFVTGLGVLALVVMVTALTALAVDAMGWAALVFPGGAVLMYLVGWAIEELASL